MSRISHRMSRTLPIVFITLLLTLLFIVPVSADSFPVLYYKGKKVTLCGNILTELNMQVGLEGATNATYTSENPAIVKIVSTDVWNLDGVPLAIIEGKKAGSTNIIVKVDTAAGMKTVKIPIDVVKYETPFKSFTVGSKSLVSRLSKSNLATCAGLTGNQKITYTMKSGWTPEVYWGYWENSGTPNAKYVKISIKSGSSVNLDEIKNKGYGYGCIYARATNSKTGGQIENYIIIQNEDYVYPAIPTLPGAAKPTPTPTPKPTKVKLTVSPSSLKIVKGKTATITAKVTPFANIVYKSSNKKVATVTTKGVVKGVSNGSTTITVESGGVKKSVKVTVIPYIDSVRDKNLNNLFAGASGWKSFSKFVNGLNKSASIKVQGLDNEKMTPQGYCVAGNYLLMSGYVTGSNSLIYVSDKSKKDKLLATIQIKGDDGKTTTYNLLSHVGGLVYDGRSTVYVADSDSALSKSVWALPLSAIDSAVARNKPKTAQAVVVKQTVNNASTKPSVITYNNDKNLMYLCSFKKNDKSGNKIQAYNPKTGKAVGKAVALEKNVQGAAFYKSGSTTYLFIATSLGQTKTSTLFVKKVTFNKDGSIKKITGHKEFVLPNMVENICVSGSKIYFGFESGAAKYTKTTGGGRRPMGYVLVGDVKKYI